MDIARKRILSAVGINPFGSSILSSIMSVMAIRTELMLHRPIARGHLLL